VLLSFPFRQMLVAAIFLLSLLLYFVFEEVVRAELRIADPLIVLIDFFLFFLVSLLSFGIVCVWVLGFVECVLGES